MRIRSFLVIVLSVCLTAMAADPDPVEIKAFALTMEKVNKFGNASRALIETGQDRAISEEVAKYDPDSKTITATVLAMQRHPKAIAAIEGAGLTPREYAVMGLALMTSVLMVTMKRRGAIKAIPPSVSAENAAFVEQNYDAIQKLMQSLQAPLK